LGVLPLIPALAGVLPVILAAIGGAIVSMCKPSVLKAAMKVLWRNKFVVIALIAAGFGLFYLKGYCQEKFGRGKGAVMQGQADWSAFRGGPDRRGTDLSGPDPVAGGTVWTFSREAKTFYASPALAGDSVFISSAEQGVFQDQGAIYRLNAKDGSVVWRFMPKGYRATFSSPSFWEQKATNGAPAKAYVVCGEGLHFTADAKLVCLSADKGELLWAVPTKSHVESSPCILDGKAYVGAGNDGFYCVALEPKDGKADVKWHLDGKQYPDCEASPAAADGKVFFCLGMEGMAVVCVDAATGKELWKTKAPYPVFGNPTVVSNRVIVGMGNGNFVETAEQVRIKELGRLKDRKASAEEIQAADRQLSQVNGEVWCLDAQDGRLLWSNKVGRVILGSIAHADGFLYAGSCDGAITCFNLDGKIVRSWNAHEPIKTSPAVGKDHVYFMTDSGRLYALDRKDFKKPVWECRVGTSGLFISSPVIGSGHVYVGTAGNGFMCLGQPAGLMQEVRWMGAFGGPGKSGWADKTPPGNQGRFMWRYPPEAGEEGATAAVARVSAPVAVGSNALFVAQSEARNGLLKLVPDKDRRKAPAEQGFYKTANGVFLSPAALDEKVYFVDGKPGDPGRKLHCLRARDLTPVWSWDVGSDATGEFVLTGSSVMIYDQANRLAFLDAGDAVTLRWSAAVASPRGAPCESKDLVFASSTRDGCVYAFSSANGGTLWKAALKSAPRTGPVTDGEVVAVGSEDGLFAAGIVDGREKWSAPCGAASTPLVMDGSRIGCVTEKGVFVTYDWAGKELGKIEGALPGITPLFCGDGALCFMSDAIQMVDATSGKATVWLPRTGWLGKLSAPGVLSEGFLYFGSESKGLVCVGPK
jgi:outer membrane protein assembly factor BamB